MKDFTLRLIAVALSASAVFAAPSNFNAERQANICQFASAVEIFAYGATGTNNSFGVTLDNVWHDIANSEYLSLYPLHLLY